MGSESSLCTRLWNQPFDPSIRHFGFLLLLAGRPLAGPNYAPQQASAPFDPLWLVWGAELGTVLSVRPTTVGAVILVFIGLRKISGWQRAILLLAACLLVFSLAHYPHKKNVWHLPTLVSVLTPTPTWEGIGDVNG